MFVWIVLLGLVQNAIGNTTGTDNKAFVEAIKQNLRKHNDDYPAVTILPTNAAISAVTANKTLALHTLNAKAVRRVYRGNMFDTNVMYDIEKNVIGLKNKFRNSMKETPFETSHRQPVSTYGANKMQKFQKFFQRNKGLFKDFVKSKLAGRLGPPMRPPLLFHSSKTEQESPATHKRDLLEGDKSSRETTIDPERLDMLPAVGGRIHYWRLKGRLCHRHVLMPEGPKYDSGGRIYLPAHTVHRPYTATHRPRLLLPRCCNCCKNSVLGCE